MPSIGLCMRIKFIENIFINNQLNTHKYTHTYANIPLYNICITLTHREREINKVFNPNIIEKYLFNKYISASMYQCIGVDKHALFIWLFVSECVCMNVCSLVIIYVCVCVQVEV